MLSLFVSQKLCALIQARSKEDLTTLGELIEAGKVTPVVGARFPLDEAPEAIRHFEEGHARGRVVITV